MDASSGVAAEGLNKPQELDSKVAASEGQDQLSDLQATKATEGEELETDQEAIKDLTSRDSETNEDNEGSAAAATSVKGRKKRDKWRRIKENRVKKRRQKKAESKAKVLKAAEAALSETDGNPEADAQGHSKKFRKRLEKERLEAVMKKFLENKTGFDGLHVCFDLQFESLMSDKELAHLAGQLGRVYGANRSSQEPALISLTSLATESRTMTVCQQKSQGFANYIWHCTPEPVTSAFKPTTSDDEQQQHKVVYLTPDSPRVLQTLEPRTIYVIGGLVDGSIKKNSSQAFASEHNIETARLPILEHATTSSKSFVKTVLTVNQVFDILMKFRECHDWREALKKGLPNRFGFEIHNDVTV